jgi:cobalt-zinc-cadmium efflux system outer membrane protein
MINIRTYNSRAAARPHPAFLYIIYICIRAAAGGAVGFDFSNNKYTSMNKISKHNSLTGALLKAAFLYIIYISTGATANAQPVPISYRDYLDRVVAGNKGYAAEKMNISVADAGITAAKVFNDPSLAFEYGYNDDKRLKMGQSLSVEIGKTFTIGKRTAAIDLARSEKELDEALLEDYFHSLRAEASLAYLEALKQTEIYQVKVNTYEQIRRIAEADSIRHALGEIGEIDAIQAKVEAGIAYNDIIQAEADLHNAFASLRLWTGSTDSVLYQPSGKLHSGTRTFDGAQLMQTAIDNRADLAAALKNVDVARKALKVTRRERNTDFDLALGYNYNTEVRNEIAPAPRFSGVTAGVSIPLKFSNLNRGAVRAAEHRMIQAQLNYEQARLEVGNSVGQRLRSYNALEEQARRYNTLLKDAQTVMEGKIYSYNRGETTLLEVLDARRTYDDVRTGQIETMHAATAALIELERAAGLWDIEF